MAEHPEKDKKQIPLRLSASLWRELAAWAEEDFRSINGQIEYLLTDAVRRKRGRKDSGPKIVDSRSDHTREPL
jgi:hypothetical protein